MNDRVYAWLEDIRLCTYDSETFVKDIDNYKEFSEDLKTRKAVERSLEIIAEAINRNSRKIISTRSKIIHGYDLISYEVIWEIAKNHIYPLRKEVEFLLLKNN